MPGPSRDPRTHDAHSTDALHLLEAALIDAGFAPVPRTAELRDALAHLGAAAGRGRDSFVGFWRTVASGTTSGVSCVGRWANLNASLNGVYRALGAATHEEMTSAGHALS